jgi:hypothetical protein
MAKIYNSQIKPPRICLKDKDRNVWYFPLGDPALYGTNMSISEFDPTDVKAYIDMYVTGAQKWLSAVTSLDELFAITSNLPAPAGPGGEDGNFLCRIIGSSRRVDLYNLAVSSHYENATFHFDTDFDPSVLATGSTIRFAEFQIIKGETELIVEKLTSPTQAWVLHDGSSWVLDTWNAAFYGMQFIAYQISASSVWAGLGYLITGDNGVWQHIKGEAWPGNWDYFSDNQDFVDDQELEEAIAPLFSDAKISGNKLVMIGHDSSIEKDVDLAYSSLVATFPPNNTRPDTVQFWLDGTIGP